MNDMTMITMSDDVGKVTAKGWAVVSNACVSRWRNCLAPTHEDGYDAGYSGCDPDQVKTARRAANLVAGAIEALQAHDALMGCTFTLDLDYGKLSR